MYPCSLPLSRVSTLELGCRGGGGGGAEGPGTVPWWPRGEKAGGVPLLAFPEPRCSPGWKVVAGMRSGGTEPDSRARVSRAQSGLWRRLPRRGEEKEGGEGGRAGRRKHSLASCVLSKHCPQDLSQPLPHHPHFLQGRANTEAREDARRRFAQDTPGKAQTGPSQHRPGPKRVLCSPGPPIQGPFQAGCAI